ncbi:MarR family winged helix-turn-helix transcriptional regulator [Planotetraspora sp. GP83]|uniref:MarR family winged helix-turn-helix transcriptional regulator n=1 Tax=Planotetraspora sp. GP83 TaxID=3156264 RepID=UPI003514B849
MNLSFDPIQQAAETWRAKFGPSSAMAAVTSIMRAHQILLAQLDTLLKPYDLTFARYEALVLLTFSRTGALSLSKIGERLMVHPTSVTNTIDRLERAELVRRMRNPKDGRGVLAEITPQGQDVVRRATDDLMRAGFGMGMYGEADLAEMFDLLKTLRVAAGDFTA